MIKKYGLFYNVSAWNKIFVALFITVSCFFIFFMIALLFAIPIFNLSFSDAKQYLISGPDTGHVEVIRFFQIFQSIGVFIIPAFLLAYIFHENYLDYLKLKKSPFLISIVLSIVTIIISIPLINYLSYLNSGINLPDSMGILEDKIVEMENEAKLVMQSFLDTQTIKGLIVNLVMICILPAIGEELLFRGIFQRLFAEWTKNIHLGVILAAVLFSFVHFQFFGFLPRFLLGIYFGYLLVWSRTIWLPVIAHFTNNTIAVMYYHFSESNVGSSEIDSFGTSAGDLIFLVMSFTLLALLIFMIYASTRSGFARRRSLPGS
jgi:membrane protease YdiL (CAAX protease family)